MSPSSVLEDVKSHTSAQFESAAAPQRGKSTIQGDSQPSHSSFSPSRDSASGSPRPATIAKRIDSVIGKPPPFIRKDGILILVDIAAYCLRKEGLRIEDLIAHIQAKHSWSEISIEASPRSSENARNKKRSLEESSSGESLVSQQLSYQRQFPWELSPEQALLDPGHMQTVANSFENLDHDSKDFLRLLVFAGGSVPQLLLHGACSPLSPGPDGELKVHEPKLLAHLTSVDACTNALNALATLGFVSFGSTYRYAHVMVDPYLRAYIKREGQERTKWEDLAAEAIFYAFPKSSSVSPIE